MNAKANLIDVLTTVGKPQELYESDDGSAVLILPHGGRILGLFAPGSEENFLWTHPALESAQAASAFYDDDQWHNSGGDRTWLAPEVDFFLPNFPGTDTYWQPRSLDPGNYQLVEDATGRRLVNRLKCPLSRSKEEVELEISKSVAPAPNPLRHEHAAALPADLQYAGYTLHTSLELLAGDGHCHTPVGLWNLLQMPHGGELLVPTFGKAHPRVYFGTVTQDDLVTGDHLIRYHMRAPGEHKIGIRAVAMTGRVGYWYPASDGRWALVIRNFAINPSGAYVDVPWDDTDDLGYAVQACNVHSDLGHFSELEYHVPAVGYTTGRSRCEDVAQVWAFRGSREDVATVIRNLLTPEV